MTLTVRYTQLYAVICLLLQQMCSHVGTSPLLRPWNTAPASLTLEKANAVGSGERRTRVKPHAPPLVRGTVNWWLTNDSFRLTSKPSIL